MGKEDKVKVEERIYCLRGWRSFTLSFAIIKGLWFFWNNKDPLARELTWPKRYWALLVLDKENDD